MQIVLEVACRKVPLVATETGGRVESREEFVARRGQPPDYVVLLDAR